MTSEIVSNRIFGQWRSSCTMSVRLQCERISICTLSSTSEMFLELPLDVERGESREGAAEGTEERVLALRTEQLR